MEKTRLGITIKLFGAGLYFLGIISIIPLVLAAGYVLLFEENQWLQRVAVKAIAVVILFAILSALLGLASNSVNAITDFTNGIFNGTLNLNIILRIIGFLARVLSVVQAAVLLLLGFRALKMRDVGVPGVDSAINSNM
ncbi:MAG: hypothetical protein FWC78_03705 [Defluviitaleaceae bacterium]|nr:hypothetical protein [Defluviitaleaceae bacterium]